MSEQMAEILATLGHVERLNVFRLLVRRYPQAVAAGELARVLGYKGSTLSVYLSVLRRAGLIHQDRAGNSLLYSADMHGAGGLLTYLFDDCCRGRIPGLVGDGSIIGASVENTHKFNALFICTGNSVRSIFAEAILRAEGRDRFDVFSAGTRPYSEINPMTLQVLRENGHTISDLRSKTIGEFQRFNSPRMDFVFTVCDQAADEECPTWPGQPITAHWGHPDPVKLEGPEAIKLMAFRETYQSLARRIRPFAQLSFNALDRASLQSKVDELGRLPLCA
ncbi:MAG: ArsR family transcriptional regulator [Rhodobacterales bacterium 65-51]|uniref:arsenate reductase/protein-tyrosine-phosphatase family protein n=1 Tax=uncultured Gemmobacter sp. TaxID=1095917 RepID=UPI00096286E5|nr:helix-turn-helix domain-containing protein [uncultured Gemmobacter sp.]OJY30054.1 MAG: ArsR family transcriptional regulator [Rhodobacterales bacterium 65-51]